ncbi:hypothetical protein [Sphingosinicella microcystinivorans]|uniref:hypothetical protein n=1 Tax=Sphingosinicella microcystinivorans TaxID=335406 RepID=UPI0022F3E044|nr:hypothetical protein [Sphingosinicella microcystinivorans]WBX85969.1 hypothetical protein PE061_08685 [Sphingosinicella microcystinivorans]
MDRIVRWQRLLALKDSWRALAVFGGMIAIFAGVAFYGASLASKPAALVEGRILRFGTYATEYGERPLVVVQLKDGATVAVRIGRSEVAACRQGSPIRLLKRGNGWATPPQACTAETSLKQDFG